VISLLGQAHAPNLPALQRTFLYHFDRFLARLSAAPVKADADLALSAFW
jgi:hypothetical protein